MAPPKKPAALLATGLFFNPLYILTPATPQDGDWDLRMNLFSLYIYIEIGGTGGGCFMYMYSRFLKEADKIVGNKAFNDASAMFNQAGEKFTEIGMMFKDAEKVEAIEEKIQVVSQKFLELAEVEEEAYNHLLHEL